MNNTPTPAELDTRAEEVMASLLALEPQWRFEPVPKRRDYKRRFPNGDHPHKTPHGI